MGNRLGGYGQDNGGGASNGAVVETSDETITPFIEDIPDVTEETSPQTLDDIITMIITKYETVINSGQLLDGNLATVPELKKRNQQLQGTLAKIVQILKEKQNVSNNMVKHNEALQHQVDSLKDVIAITRDLLNIRNTEVDHLHEDLKSLQEKIALERNRQTEVTQKMESASRLNDSLKAEYQKQMDLFSKLRVKYEERQDALSRENNLLQKQLDIAKNIVNSNHSSTAPPLPVISEDKTAGDIKTAVSDFITAESAALNNNNNNIVQSADVQALNTEIESVLDSESADDNTGAVRVVLKTVDNVLRLEQTTHDAESSKLSQQEDISDEEDD